MNEINSTHLTQKCSRCGNNQSQLWFTRCYGGVCPPCLVSLADEAYRIGRLYGDLQIEHGRLEEELDRRKNVTPPSCGTCNERLSLIYENEALKADLEQSQKQQDALFVALSDATQGVQRNPNKPGGIAYANFDEGWEACLKYIREATEGPESEEAEMIER